MALRSEMSVGGLYAFDNTIFDRMHIPMSTDETDPWPFVSRDIIVQNILMDTMDLEVLYPDPDFMKEAIRVWSLAMQDSWQHIAEALYKRYEPLENYDRQEEWTDEGTRTDNLTEKNNGGMTGSGSVSETTGGNITTSKKGYNSGAWVAGEKQDSTGSVSNTTTDSTTTNNTRTNTGTVGNKGEHKGRVHGNVGVTTSQQMLEAEIKLRAEYQLTFIITNDFKRRFCLLVY
ncbi:MAG: hypothetical protein IIZ93_10130 [Acidaminococcaceae bacterium]|nr:hypothetical protein [Acidaminococcaceae bacterium]